MEHYHFLQEILVKYLLSQKSSTCQLKKIFGINIILLNVISFNLFALTEIESNSNLSSEQPQSNQETDKKTSSTEDNITDAPTSPKKILVITSSRLSSDKALNNQYITVDDTAINPTNITELLSSQAGLSTNGQPGLFQTVNIRGLARQRVQTYVDGMQITSERRAGVAASFIDPTLLSGVEVTQGPASTYYGSGAIAGTLHLQTRQQETNWYNAGFNTDGNEWNTAFGSGDEDLSAIIAYRTRNNGETALGDLKNNHFKQHSIIFLKSYKIDQYQLDWHIIESRGNNIGKDNSRFPASRITSYPEEKHLLSKLSLTSDQDWSAKIYFHKQSLTTQDIRPEKRINQIANKSLDVGFSIENKWQSNHFNGLYGLDYFGRRNVDANEHETSLTDQTSSQFSSLVNGRENESALFTTINRSFENFSLHAGLRANYQSQKSESSEMLSEDFTTYFLAAKKQINHLNLSLSYGTGFRFASLSERLFTGTTGRGTTIGNPDLNPEKSRSIDFGINYQKQDYSIDFHYFRSEIDDFIEKIKIDEDNSSYLNLTNGTLKGWQYHSSYSFTNHLSLELSGQDVNGEDNLGSTLADIPPERHQLSIKIEQGDWLTRMSYTKNMRKDSFGDGEIALESSDIANFKLAYKLSNSWNIQFNINNLFDEVYFNSADDLSTLATGREFSISVFNH